MDAIGADSMLDRTDVKCVGSFGSESMYFATWEGNPIMQRIDYAVNEVTTQDFDFTNELFKKYFQAPNSLYDATFTREEATFIESCPTLKVAFGAVGQPMSYVNGDGQVMGITPDMLRLIEQKTGFTFEFFPLPGQSSEFTYDYFRENGVDLIAGIEVNRFNENTPGLLLTDPYFSATKCLVGQRGRSISAQDALTIAVVGGSVTLPRVIAEEFPNFVVEPYDTIDECLSAVQSGQADVLLYNQYLIQEYLGRPQYENLTIIPQMSLEEQTALSPVTYFADVNPEKAALTSDPRLIAVLDKAISCLDPNDVNEVIIRYTVEEGGDISLQDSIYEYRFPLLGILALVVVVIVLLVLMMNAKQRNLAVVSKKNEQLSEAVKQADSANQTKSQFLAQMSHEIHTPMNAIVGMTALAQRVDGNPEQTDEYLRKIDVSSKMLLSIINDVLDMSAIENNKLKIASSSFDIKELLLSLSTVYYGQCREKGVDFKLAVLDGIDEMLIGDSLRLNQILMNVVSNAYKFTSAGGSVRVGVSLLTKREGKEFLRFLAEDFDLNREVACALLGGVNLEVDCAVDGAEAVKMFEESQPGTYDVILMDIQMPNMDGLEAARTIRASAHPQAATVPMFAMTANAFSEDVTSALSAGMNGHIAKPIDTDALFALLQKTLGGADKAADEADGGDANTTSNGNASSSGTANETN